jgi:hypothetical protein
MKTQLIAAATIASFAFAGAAFAASTSTTTAPAKTPDQKCTALTIQFNDAVKTHATHAKFTQAKTLGTTGEQMCQNKKEDGGIKDLQRALKMLGVKPTA